MKRFTFIWLVLISCKIGMAQSDANFSSDGIGSLWHNPASFGGINSYSVQVGSVLNDDLDNLQIPLHNLVSAEFRLGKRMNAGLVYNSNAIGFARRYSVEIPINYTFDFKKSRLSVGLSVGFEQSYVRPFYSTSPYPYPYSTLIESMRIDLDFGVYWYGEHHYIGVATTHFQGSAFIIEKGKFIRNNYYLNAGYQFEIFKKMAIYPILELRTDENSIFQMKFINYFQFANDHFSLAAGYRLNDAVLAGITGRLSRFKLAYFYAFNTNKLMNYATNKHEIRLSYNLPRFQ